MGTHRDTLAQRQGADCVGGLGNGVLNSAHLYDPATGRWGIEGYLSVVRWQHTATLLPNGMVLIAGRFSNTGIPNTAELYDSATGQWSQTSSFNVAREVHTATLLLNGRILAAGGANILSALNSVELGGSQLPSLPTGCPTCSGGFHIAYNPCPGTQPYQHCNVFRVVLLLRNSIRRRDSILNRKLCLLQGVCLRVCIRRPISSKMPRYLAASWQ